MSGYPWIERHVFDRQAAEVFCEHELLQLDDQVRHGCYKDLWPMYCHICGSLLEAIVGGHSLQNCEVGCFDDTYTPLERAFIELEVNVFLDCKYPHGEYVAVLTDRGIKIIAAINTDSHYFGNGYI